MSLAAGTGGNGTRENAVLPFLSARACSALELTASVNLLFHDKKHFDGQLGGRGKGRGRTRGWKWRCGRPGVTRRRYGRVLAGSSSVLSAQPSFQRGRSRPRAASERAPQRAPAAVLPGYGLRCGPGPLPAAWCLVPGLPRNISAAGGRRAGGNPPLPVCGSPVPTALHPPMLSSFSRPAAAGRRPRAVAVRDLKIGAKWCLKHKLSKLDASAFFPTEVHLPVFMIFVLTVIGEGVCRARQRRARNFMMAEKRGTKFVWLVDNRH